MKELELDMIGIGPFIPHPETPLSQNSPGNPILTLKVIAVTRLLLPFANIPATTALGTLSPSLRLKAFSCGANVVMIDITPLKYAKLYSIYPRRIKTLSSYSYWTENY